MLEPEQENTTDHFLAFTVWTEESVTNMILMLSAFYFLKYSSVTVRKHIAAMSGKGKRDQRHVYCNNKMFFHVVTY